MIKIVHVSDQHQSSPRAAQFIPCFNFTFFIFIFHSKKNKDLFVLIYQFHNFILRSSQNKFVPLTVLCRLWTFSETGRMKQSLKLKKDLDNKTFNPTVLIMVRSFCLKTGDDNLFRFSLIYVIQKIDICLIRSCF